MTGMVFRYFFFVMSFLVLWLQPNDPMNYKAFFITFFTFIGSWWIDKIAIVVDGIKAFRQEMRKKNNSSKDSIKEKWNRYVDMCENYVSAFLVALNGFIMLICVVIGAFLFVISIMGIMNFIEIEADSSQKLWMVVETGSDEVVDSQTGQIPKDTYGVQKYLFEDFKLDIKVLFYLSGVCVVLELMYLLIYASFDKFYNKLRG